MAEEGFTFISDAILPVVALPSSLSRAKMTSMYSSTVFFLIAPPTPRESSASLPRPIERWPA